MRKTVIYLFSFLLVSLFFLVFYQKFQMNSTDEMDKLINRLHYAFRPPITIGGEVILYQPQEDKTIRTEILAKGFTAVPYLIKGLYHNDKQVRSECIDLLGKIPRKEGVRSLIELISSQEDYDCMDLHLSLRNLLSNLPEKIPFELLDDNGKSRIFLKDTWLPLWKKHKDHIINTESGIALKQDDGTIIPLPITSPTSTDSKPEQATTESSSKKSEPQVNDTAIRPEPPKGNTE